MCWTNVLNNQTSFSVRVHLVRWRIPGSRPRSGRRSGEHFGNGSYASVARRTPCSGPKLAEQRGRSEFTPRAPGRLRLLPGRSSLSTCRVLTIILHRVVKSPSGCSEVSFSEFFSFSILFAIFLGNCILKNFQCVYLVMWRRFFVHCPLRMKGKLGVSQFVDSIATGLMSKKRRLVSCHPRGGGGKGCFPAGSAPTDSAREGAGRRVSSPHRSRWTCFKIISL